MLNDDDVDSTPVRVSPKAGGAIHTEVAHAFECITEQELAALTGCSCGTLENWRKRGKGPAYALVGAAYLYPQQAVRAWIAQETRDRKSTTGLEL